MMRSPRSFAIVVRRKSGLLVVREAKMSDRRKGWLAWPMVRGAVTLVEALRLGSRALRFSSEQYELDLESEEREGREAKPGGKGARAGGDSASHLLRTMALGVAALALSSGEGPPAPASPPPAENKRSFTMTLALVVALVVFVALPQAVAAIATRVLHMDLDIRSPGFQLLTGVFKLLIVVGYMLAIRKVPEIRRVFQYHGAEHKAIATYEAGEALTVERARGKPRLHPRCGTTFLVMVVFVSILVFTAIGPFLPKLPIGGVAENVLFFLMKLPFLPVIAAITYEIQRVSARYCLTGPLRAALWPGFAVQRITTIEPDEAQLEVALASMRATLWREEAGADAADAPPDRFFDSFGELMAAPGYGAAREAAGSHASA
jgi:uncharacterized protein YqhQ